MLNRQGPYFRHIFLDGEDFITVDTCPIYDGEEWETLACNDDGEEIALYRAKTLEQAQENHAAMLDFFHAAGLELF